MATAESGGIPAVGGSLAGGSGAVGTEDVSSRVPVGATTEDGSSVFIPRCRPRAVGGPFWLAELETVSIALECGQPSVDLALKVTNLPSGASYDPGTRRITFTPGLDQAGVYRLEIAAPGAEDVGHVEVQVADRFDDPGNRPVDPETYTMEYGIPVLHLDVDRGINRDDYTPASIVYRGYRFQGAEAKYRGQTSYQYPKRSYTLKFTKSDRFSGPESVAGFVAKRKVTLTTPFDDNSYLRSRLTFQLWNELSSDHVQVEHDSVVVFLNGTYYGLYTLTDHVDRHLMKDNGFFEDGNLYKARSHICDFRLTEPRGGLPKETLADGYEKKEGTPEHGEPGAYADIEDLVLWVATSSRESFLAELDTRLARRDYENWWLLVGFVVAGDSAGKNSYHYRDPRPGAPDGRFHYIPWDFNDSFGQNWRSRRRRPEGNDPSSFARLNMIFERLLADPETRDPLLARFRDVLDGVWSADAIVAQLDAWEAQIHEVALRDERRWGAAYTDFFTQRADRDDILTYEQEIAYVRQWIFDRHAFVRDVYLAAPLEMAPAVPDELEEDISSSLEGSLDPSDATD